MQTQIKTKYDLFMIFYNLNFIITEQSEEFMVFRAIVIYNHFDK